VKTLKLPFFFVYHDNKVHNHNMSQEVPNYVKLHDLASDRVGGKVLYSTDDFFAEKENLIKHEPAVWIADKYTDKGKWMDGKQTAETNK
jgi:allantoicase